MYKELIAELRDYDGPVIYEDADGQHVECTAVDLTRQAADAIDKLRAEQQEMMDLLSDITQKYDTCVKIQCQMTEVSNALQAELERVKHEREEQIMRLIDADKMKEVWAHGDMVYESCGIGKALCMAVDAMPTIDAVHVVRCKECKRWQRHTEVDRERGPCRITGMTTHQDDFCSYGEPKEAQHVDKR